MKKLIAILSLTALSSCSVLPAPVSYEDKSAVARLEAQEQVLSAQLDNIETELAKDPTDPELVAAYNAVLEQKREVEAAYTKLEEKILRDKFGPLITTFAMVPGIGGFIPELGALLMALVPLLGKRGRKHYKDAIVALNPFVGGKVSPIGAANSLLKALGAKHTEE